MELTSQRRFLARRPLTALLLPLLAVALLAAGCSDSMDKGSVHQVPPAEPPAWPWLLGVWGSGPADVYAVGRPGLLLHYDGSAWELQDASRQDTLTAVWGSGPGDVWVCGFHGLIMHSTGNGQWQRQSAGTGENLYAIGRGPAGLLYACGQNGALVQNDGSGWRPSQPLAYRYASDGTPVDTLQFWREVSTFTVVTPYGIGGSDANVILADPHTEYGHQWLWGFFQDPHRNTITAAFGSETVADNYMANRAGELFTLVGAGDELLWVRATDPQGDPSNPATYPDGITGIWVQDADWLLVTSQRGFIARWRRDGSETAIDYVVEGGLPLSGIWGAAPDDVWAVGYGGLVLHYDGTAWQRVAVPLPEGVTP